jgi:PAS domain S-box-containing protein
VIGSSLDFQRLFQGAPALFVVLEPQAPFTVLEASDAYLAATRTTRETLVGRPLFDAFPGQPLDSHAATIANLRASLARVLATRAADTMEIQKYDLPRSAGEGGGFEERYWSPVNSPVLGKDGEVLGIVHRVEDVTALERAKREKDEERARADLHLRSTEILESITEGFFALDYEWRFTYMNREGERILGRPREELVGKSMWDEYPGVTGSKFERAYRQAMEERIASSLLSHYPDHDRWYGVRTYPAPHGLSVFFSNVTAEKEGEVERARLIAHSESQRRIYETALSNTPDLVYVFDLQHRFTFANHALLSMWGKTIDEAVGKTCLELGYEPWHAEMHGREIEQVVATRKPLRGEVPFTGKTGRRVYDYIFSPVFGPGGEVVAVAGTTRDITERQQAEQEIREQAERLRESDRAKDEFLATLSHELRNPLAPLRNSLSLLRMAGDADAKTAPIHEMMERQVNHLVRLVDDLLEMSRISRGTFALRKERVEIAAVVRNAVETSQPLMQAAKHTLEVSLPAQPLWVEGDSVRIAQILFNLLDNAAKYTEDGGRVAVAVSGTAGSVAISIRDNGAGIAPEALPRMFEMFIRGDRTGARGQGGLGIGLTLSRRLAEMHGGSIEARSEGTGRGSEFAVHLPLPSDEGDTPPGTDANAPHPQRTGRRVLIADDNEDAANSLGMLLELAGHQVRIAHGGLAALKIAAEFRPDAVLLDIGMPDLNGYDTARALRAAPGGTDLELIALTGWGHPDDKNRAAEAGFDRHLTKPVDPAELEALLSVTEFRSGAARLEDGSARER